MMYRCLLWPTSSVQTRWWIYTTLLCSLFWFCCDVFSPDSVRKVVRLWPLAEWVFMLSLLWPGDTVTWSLRCLQGDGADGEDRLSCVRAFFLLNCLVWLRGGNTWAGLVLVGCESTGRLRRLSQEGHTITSSFSGPVRSVCGISPDAVQKSRILESHTLLSSN